MLQQRSTAFFSAKVGPKHHYIPVFYLKCWAGTDGLLCEYSRPYKEVKPQRKSPKATAFVRGLYNIPGLPPNANDILERQFLSLADNWAARAHQILLSSDRSIDFPDLRTKAGWARFIYSLILRTPEYIENNQHRFVEHAIETAESIKNDYHKLRRPTDPESFDEFKAKFLANPTNTAVQSHLHRLIDSKTVIAKICEMRWFTVFLDNSPFTLLTSDRPVIMTNGLSNANSHIVIPLSPNRLFVAVNSDRMASKLRSMKPKEFIQRSNDRVCNRAIRYVFGADDSQLCFVSRRLGRKERSSPLDP